MTKIWTNDEIEFLITEYPLYGARHCAEILERTEPSVFNKAYRLGLKAPSLDWTKDEVEYLKNNYSNFGPKLCAQTLNRTESSITKKAKTLSLKVMPGAVNRIWSHEKYENELFNREIDYWPIEEYKGSGTKIKHICLNDHIWNVPPYAILKGEGCPECSNTSFNPNAPAILYYVKLEYENEIFYKVGITRNSIAKRFKNDRHLKITILLEQHFETGLKAKNQEKQILTKFKDKLVSSKGFISRGSTETFEEDVLNLDK